MRSQTSDRSKQANIIKRSKEPSSVQQRSGKDESGRQSAANDDGKRQQWHYQRGDPEPAAVIDYSPLPAAENQRKRNEGHRLRMRTPPPIPQRLNFDSSDSDSDQEQSVRDHSFPGVDEQPLFRRTPYKHRLGKAAGYQSQNVLSPAKSESWQEVPHMEKIVCEDEDEATIMDVERPNTVAQKRKQLIVQRKFQELFTVYQDDSGSGSDGSKMSMLRSCVENSNLTSDDDSQMVAVPFSSSASMRSRIPQRAGVKEVTGINKAPLSLIVKKYGCSTQGTFYNGGFEQGQCSRQMTSHAAGARERPRPSRSVSTQSTSERQRSSSSMSRRMRSKSVRICGRKGQGRGRTQCVEIVGRLEQVIVEGVVVWRAKAGGSKSTLAKYKSRPEDEN